MSTPSSSIETTPVMPRRSSTVFDPYDTSRTHRADRDRDSLEAMLAEAADLLEILLQGPRDHEQKPPRHVGLSAPQLVDLARTAVRRAHSDGFRNHSAGADAPEAKPRNVLDKHGDVIPPDPDPGPPVSDPIGEAIARTVDAKPAELIHAQRIADAVESALDHLRVAVNGLVNAQPHDTEDDSKTKGEPCCKSCARLNIFEPIYDQARKHELCRWCYLFWLKWSQWPPKPILERRAAGLVIRTKHLKEAGIGR